MRYFFLIKLKDILKILIEVSSNWWRKCDWKIRKNLWLLIEKIKVWNFYKNQSVKRKESKRKYGRGYYLNHS